MNAPLDIIQDEFVRAYIETALWSEADDGQTLDSKYAIQDIHPDTLAQMQADCAKFQAENAADLDEKNCLKCGPDYGPKGRAGHDFWLTRNHHGAGFWDGDWEEAAGERLTKAAHAFGECDLYVGDDGKIHC